MAYTPLGLKDGEKVYASHVTHVEDGIADCESQITEVKNSLSEVNVSGIYKALANGITFSTSFSGSKYAVIFASRVSSNRTGLYLCNTTDGLSAISECNGLTITYEDDNLTIYNGSTSIYVGILIIG